MAEYKNNRAPVSQKSHTIEKPKNPEYIGGSVTIQINEKELVVPTGTTILEACRQHNIHIPFSLSSIYQKGFF